MARATATPRLRRSLYAGLAVGALAAVVANIYRVAYTAYNGLAFPEITLATTTAAAFVPGVLAGAAYHVAVSRTPHGRLAFTSGVLALSALSVLPALLAPLHPGFAGMSAPLHLIVGATLAFGVPLVASRLGRVVALRAGAQLGTE